MNPLIFLLVLAFCASCSSLKVHSEKDSFSGAMVHSVDAHPLSDDPVNVVDYVAKRKAGAGTATLGDGNASKNSLPLIDASSITLAARKIVSDGKPVEYEITAVRSCEGCRKLSIRQKNSLQINVDGEVLSYSTEDDPDANFTVASGFFLPVPIERATYQHISSRDFNKIVKGKSVRVRLVGSKNTEDAYLSPNVYETFVSLASAGTSARAE